MPKSAKKRKDKAADFTKAKLKLGKEKRLPSNVIDTSFKARSIALPTQTITTTKDENTPTTKRKLTFSELLAHLKHYNVAIRKGTSLYFSDAITGLTELLEAHWTLVEQHLVQLVNSVARVIGDEDASVRKQLLAFLSWLLSRLPKEDLIPHAPTLLLFATSAQTHIFPEIRVDAMRFLSLFLEHMPELVVEGWNVAGPSCGRRILEGYIGNLSAGTKYEGVGGASVPTIVSTSSVVFSPASKLAVLQSLSSFLQAGLAMSGRSEDNGHPRSAFRAWFMSGSFKSQDAFHQFESTLASRTLRASCHPPWSAGAYTGNDLSVCLCYPAIRQEAPWTVQELAEALPSSGGPEDGFGRGGSASTLVPNLARTLHPILVSTVLDYASSAFSPDGKTSEVELTMIVTVNQIASLLYGVILRESPMPLASSVSELEAFLSYLSPYFPFGSSRDNKFAQRVQDLNLIFCQLTSLLVLHSRSVSFSSGRHSQPTQNQLRKSNDALMMQVANVSQYIANLLRGQSVASGQVHHSLVAGSYLALLPSIWAIINNSCPELSPHAADVLHTTLDHAVTTSSKSSSKRLTIEFVARLMLLGMEPQYQGVFQPEGGGEAAEKFETWLIHLPRVLWEVGDCDVVVTEVILRFLLRLLHGRSLFVQSKTIVAVQSRLVPYFIINHPVRGQLPGPYNKLPQGQSHLRRLCLDVVFTILACAGHFGATTSEACDALSTAVGLAVAGTIEAEYWAHVHQGTSSC